MELHERIAQARQDAGLTQEQFAAATGKSRSAVTQWESGLVRPRQRIIKKIAEVTGKPLMWLEVGFTLDALDARVAARASAPPEESYTSSLLSRGVEKCAQKLGEEAVETVIAAVEGNRAEVVTESADLLYHLLVVLKIADIPLNEVLAELQRRTAQTGLEEKAGRPKA